MTVNEFSEKLQQFVDQARSAGIPLEDIVVELEDIRDSIEEEIEESKDPEEEKEND